MASEVHREQPGGIDSLLRWPTHRAEVWTTKFIACSEKDPNIKAIVAIGSAVRINVASVDVDLIVVCDRPQQFSAKPPIEVDLRVYAAEEADDLIGAGNDMMIWAVMFGVCLFQQRRYWDTIVETWTHKLPLPSPDVARRRADEALTRLTALFGLGDLDAAHEQAVSYLTHMARFELLSLGVHPASRPELPTQLEASARPQLATTLRQALMEQTSPTSLMIERVIAYGERMRRG